MPRCGLEHLRGATGPECLGRRYRDGSLDESCAEARCGRNLRVTVLMVRSCWAGRETADLWTRRCRSPPAIRSCYANRWQRLALAGVGALAIAVGAVSRGGSARVPGSLWWSPFSMAPDAVSGADRTANRREWPLAPVPRNVNRIRTAHSSAVPRDKFWSSLEGSRTREADAKSRRCKAGVTKPPRRDDC